MKPEEWIAIAGLLATTIISIMSMVLSRRREKQQQERDDRLRKEQQEREDKLRKEQQAHEIEEEAKRRTYSPHIEFEITCSFYGPEKDDYVAEFLFIARNKGLIQQKFKDIRFRVRGIESNQPLSYLEGYEPRLAFPIKIINDVSILPKGYNYLFVEPGIEQVFTFVTKIPLSVKYILAYTEFAYDEFTPHTSERIFTVKSGGEQN